MAEKRLIIVIRPTISLEVSNATETYWIAIHEYCHRQPGVGFEQVAIHRVIWLLYINFD